MIEPTVALGPLHDAQRDGRSEAIADRGDPATNGSKRSYIRWIAMLASTISIRTRQRKIHIGNTLMKS